MKSEMRDLKKYISAKSQQPYPIDRAVIQTNKYGKITSWNKNAEKLFQYKKEEALGKNIHKDLKMHPSQKQIKEIQKHLRKGLPWIKQALLKRKDGSIFLSQIIGIPSYDKNERLTGAIRLIKDITSEKRNDEAQDFLTYASRELAKTLDYKVTISKLSALIVPKLADWFSIEMIANTGNIELLTFIHKDPKLAKIGRSLREGRKLDLNLDRGVPKVIKTGLPELYSQITDADIRTSTLTEKEFQKVKKVGYTSAMIVPLVSRARVLGAITFARADNLSDHYTKQDLGFAEEFARRAAIALDNSLLFQGIQNELIERRKAEEHLKQISERLELAQRIGNIGTFEWDLTEGKLIWSSALEELYNLEPGTFDEDYNSWLSFIHPEDREETQKQLKKAIKNKKELDIQFRIVLPNGEQRWIATQAQTFYDDEEKPKRMVGVNMDITARKKLETDLRESRDQLDVIFQNVADGITVQDKKGNLIFANDAAAKQLGFETSDEVIKNLSGPQREEIINRFEIKGENGNDFPVTDLPGRRAVLGETNPQAIIQYKDRVKDMSYWSLVKARPIFDEEGKVQYAVNIISDITERKEAERRKDEFISMASHELKTPLTSLKAYVQILKRRIASVSKEESLIVLYKVENQIDKLSRLISDFLDISKIQAGKIELRKDNFDLDSLIAEIAENFNRSVSSHKIAIEGNTQATIFGDKDRIGQVLNNLISNAIKYSPDANKVIIKCSNEDNKAKIQICDFGIGIGKEYHKKIFDRFYQIDGINQKKFPGLGIGLFISLEITKRHNGKIEVESQKGIGSKFSLILPMVQNLDQNKSEIKSDKLNSTSNVVESPTLM